MIQCPHILKNEEIGEKMVKIGVAISNKDVAQQLTRHLTKDNLIKAYNISQSAEFALNAYSKVLYDVVIIDSKLKVFNTSLIDLLNGVGLNNHHTKLIEYSTKNNLIFDSIGDFALKNKPSSIDDSKRQLMQLGFSSSLGTELLAQLINYCITNKIKYPVLSKIYEELATSNHIDKTKVKWNIENSYKAYKNSKPLGSKYNYMSLKEFVEENIQM